MYFYVTSLIIIIIIIINKQQCKRYFYVTSLIPLLVLKQNKTDKSLLVVFHFLSRNRSMLRAKDRREKKPM